jgi:DNA polymerase III gamma/tau subunit
MLEGNSSEVIKTIDLLYQNSVDIQHLCSDFIQFYHEVMLSLVLDSVSYRSLSSNEFSSLAKQKIPKKLNVSQIIKILDILQDCSENLKNSSNRRLLFEICILKLCSSLSNIEIVPSSKDMFNCMDNGSNLLMPSNVKTERSKKFDDKKSKQKKHIVPLSNWQDVLNDIRVKDKNGMLFGFLVESQAFVIDDKLYINSKNSVVAEKILEKKAFISDIIKSKTGKDYRIFLKRPTNDRHTENKLENFLKLAEKAGITIDEE